MSRVALGSSTDSKLRDPRLCVFVLFKCFVYPSNPDIAAVTCFLVGRELVVVSIPSVQMRSSMERGGVVRKVAPENIYRLSLLRAAKGKIP